MNLIRLTTRFDSVLEFIRALLTALKMVPATRAYTRSIYATQMPRKIPPEIRSPKVRILDTNRISNCAMRLGPLSPIAHIRAHQSADFGCNELILDGSFGGSYRFEFMYKLIFAFTLDYN